ncbi:hypothetical protein B0H11DRAFT_2406428 [Mycena galericulata]|nr:hypothetical protein B0H11DRAFT_2406428 [Mycena galericulata]
MNKQSGHTMGDVAGGIQQRRQTRRQMLEVALGMHLGFPDPVLKTFTHQCFRGRTTKENSRARAEVRFCARAGPKSRGAEHAVRAKHVDGIKLPNSRAGTPKKASLRGGVKSLRGGHPDRHTARLLRTVHKTFKFTWELMAATKTDTSTDHMMVVLQALMVFPWMGGLSGLRSAPASKRPNPSHTGIKLTLVEGIETARKLDHNVLNEIKTSLTTGVLKNANNELFHRMGRSSQRQSAAAKRSRESTQRAERMAELQSMINDGKVLMKEHQDELKSLKGTSTRSTKTKSHKSTDGSIIISASSCGRVKTVPLPSKAKGVFVAANYFITVEFSLDVNSASAPGPDGNNLKYAVIDVDVPEDTEVLDSRDKDIPKSPAQTLAVTEHTNGTVNFLVNGGGLIHLVIDIGVPEALAALESLAVPVAPAADPWEFFGRPVEFSYPAPIPASDFSAFRMGDDLTFPISGAFDSIPSYNAFNSGFEPFFGNHGNSAYNFDLDLSLFGLDAAPNPAQHDALDSFQNFEWCALTPPQQLPTLPPPPSSSPSTPAEPMESATAVASRGKRPRRDEVDEQNIIHSKRSRAMSSRAADAAAASKKPKRS